MTSCTVHIKAFNPWATGNRGVPSSHERYVSCIESFSTVISWIEAHLENLFNEVIANSLLFSNVHPAICAVLLCIMRHNSKEVELVNEMKNCIATLLNTVGCRNTEPWPCSARSLNNPFIFHLGAPERILDCCSSFLNAEGQVSISTLYVWGWYQYSICLAHTIVKAKGRDSL